MTEFYECLRVSEIYRSHSAIARVARYGILDTELFDFFVTPPASTAHVVI